MKAALTDEWFGAGFYAEVSNTSFRMHHENCAPYTFVEAQGLYLWCPCMYGRDRAHLILVPFAGRALPPNHGPTRDGVYYPRWQAKGNDLSDLTIAPSIAVGSAVKECWHGFIKDGIVT